MSIEEDSAKDNPLLRLRRLCKSYSTGSFLEDSLRAIDNVDMDVKAGESRGIVGESGAGKTTLARCCLRLIEPSSGSVQLDGQDLLALSASHLRARRKDFQMVFQDAYASLNPAMTVEQILLEPLQVHRVGDRESRLRLMHEQLEAVSLSRSLISRKAGELSGGQQQRVGIARCLILRPRLVIADEPTSALDASVQAQILNLLADLKKQYGLTLMLISHSLRAIHYLCTDISVLYKGRLVEEAPAEIFFREPRHPYSRTLLDATPVLGAPRPLRLSAMNEFSPSSTGNGLGCAFHPYCFRRLPVCTREEPPLQEVGTGERVACFLFSNQSRK